MTIYRPGQHLYYPGPGVRVVQPGGAAVPWWLSGGIAAANCIAAYTPKGAASLAASYDNNAAPGNGLPDGTYDATLGVAPTFDAATGWTFLAASTQYLLSGWVPAGDQNQSVIVRLSGGVGTNFACGIYESGTKSLALRPGHFSAPNWVHSYTNGGALTLTGDLRAAAVMAVAGSTAYLNGVAEAGVVGGWGGAPTSVFGIGAAMNLLVPTYWSGNIQALAIYNTTLTAPQVLAVYTAMAAL